MRAEGPPRADNSEAATTPPPIMDLVFLAKKFVSVLLMPPLLPVLITAIGLALLPWRRRAGLIVAWGGIVVALVLMLPATVAPMVGRLESDPVITPQQLKSVQAIVVLAGGRRAYAPEFGGDTINRISLERLRYGAKLARETKLPVLVAGGAPSHGTPEGELMRRALLEDYGITAKWVETRSYDTADNARNSAPMLRAAGIQRIALVTHAAHMKRAAEEFRRQGFEVIPAPTAFLTGTGGSEEVLTDAPSIGSVYAAWYGLHEWTGILWQKLRRG